MPTKTSMKCHSFTPAIFRFPSEPTSLKKFLVWTLADSKLGGVGRWTRTAMELCCCESAIRCPRLRTLCTPSFKLAVSPVHNVNQVLSLTWTTNQQRSNTFTLVGHNWGTLLGERWNIFQFLQSPVVLDSIVFGQFWPRWLRVSPSVSKFPVWHQLAS